MKRGKERRSHFRFFFLRGGGRTFLGELEGKFGLNPGCNDGLQPPEREVDRCDPVGEAFFVGEARLTGGASADKGAGGLSFGC